MKANQLLVYNLFRTPFYEENYAFFAIFLCCDVLWYMFSILILRSWLLVLSIVIYIVTRAAHAQSLICSGKENHGIPPKLPQLRVRFCEADPGVLGMLHHLLLRHVLHVIVNSPLNRSYHYIRSISGFKTYLIMNILGTFDHLFTSIEHVHLLSLLHSRTCPTRSSTPFATSPP